MAHGGKRQNSGRPKGSKASHTIQAQAFRERLIQRVNEEQEPIINALIKQAKAGQVQALKEILERVLGRVKTTLEVEKSDPQHLNLTPERMKQLDDIAAEGEVD